MLFFLSSLILLSLNDTHAAFVLERPLFGFTGSAIVGNLSANIYVAKKGDLSGDDNSVYQAAITAVSYCQKHK